MVNVPFYMVPILRQEDIQKYIQQLQQVQSQAAGEYILSKGETDKSGERLRQLKTIMSRDTSELSGSEKAKADLMNFASEGFKKGAQGLMQITQQSFDVLNTIYKELKKSSPLMEAVESLFQLAMQLFFMPLGNKLGELLIPAVMELLENVVDMWDELGDGGLASMFDVAITKGIQYLADFFTNVGDTLESQGGILTDIGEIFKTVGSFIEHNLLDVIKLILGTTTWIVEHLGTMIALIGTFMTLHYALQVATMYVIASSAATPWGQALGYAAAGIGIVGIGASLYAGSLVGYGDGGYIPATPGGKAIIVSEEGEGEYIVPESKKEQFATEILYSGIPPLESPQPEEDHYFETPPIEPPQPKEDLLTETPKVELPKPKEDLLTEMPRIDLPKPKEDLQTSMPQIELRISDRDGMSGKDPNDRAQNGDTYTIVNNFYGYTTDELERKVNDVLEDQISRARLRSGF